MRIIKIKEALERCGEQITGIHGTLTGAYKRRTGEGQYGPYSFQDGTLKDETGSISVTFCNQPDMNNRKGMKMTATAKEGEKGYTGLKVEETTYNDKKTIKLKITETAFIDFGTTPVSGDAPAAPQQNAPVRQAPAEPPPAIPEDADAEERAALEVLAKKKAEKEAARLKAEADAKARAASDEKRDALPPANAAMGDRRAVQIANLYDRAMGIAKYVLAKHSLELTDIYTATATVFIAMRDDGLTDMMPAVLVDKKPKPADYYPSGNADTAAPPKPRDEARQPDAPDTVDQEPTRWQDTLVTEGQFAGQALGTLNNTAVDILFNTFAPKTDPKTGNYRLPDLYLKNALLCWKKEQP